MEAVHASPCGGLCREGSLEARELLLQFVTRQRASGKSPLIQGVPRTLRQSALCPLSSAEQRASRRYRRHASQTKEGTCSGQWELEGVPHHLEDGSTDALGASDLSSRRRWQCPRWRRVFGFLTRLSAAGPLGLGAKAPVVSSSHPTKQAKARGYGGPARHGQS
ncbi:hypothetical protein CB1_001907055 [Camelus ferus]|nr:hypothetical protein CB1_001907055 [Camelus ferus]